eukprot:scaffold8134_cov336-Prasinococcus_capsulatus_cf.AAC.1
MEWLSGECSVGFAAAGMGAVCFWCRGEQGFKGSTRTCSGGPCTQSTSRRRCAPTIRRCPERSWRHSAATSASRRLPKPGEGKGKQPSPETPCSGENGRLR